MTQLGRLLAAAVAVGALALAAPTAAAQGFGLETTPRFEVSIEIEPSGMLEITETIVQDFGSTPRHGIIRTIPDRLRYDDRYDRVYPIEVVSVTTSDGTPDDVETSSGGGVFSIRIGDPDVTVTGEHRYTIVYRVRGALNRFDTHDELYWNAIGDDWQQEIGRMRVRVEGPAAITRLRCFQGPFGSTFGCDLAEIRDGAAVFSHEGLGANTGLSIVVALPPGTVADAAPVLDERWSLGRAFSRTPATMGGTAGLLALVVGGLAFLMWRRGRDLRYTGSPVDQVMGGPPGGPTQAVPLFERGRGPVEFAPPENLRPGQVGTLIDEEANTLDVTATIVDLAVRGHLVIEEIPRTWLFGKPDWRLTRQPKETDDLLSYERSLLDGLFRDGDGVLLSELRKTFAARLEKVKDALYADVVKKGWFRRRPDRVRQTWVAIGIVAVLLAIAILIALAWLTHAALLGVPLVIGAVVLVFGASRMPRKTAKGTAMARRVGGFRTVIETAEEHMARWAEQEHVFTRFLPYAVVFGVTERWAKAFEDLGRVPSEDVSWYVSSRAFVATQFADSLDSFAVTTSGVIASTPSGSGGSGLGGGGFSGGGGGGGGGGSW